MEIFERKLERITANFGIKKRAVGDQSKHDQLGILHVKFGSGELREGLNKRDADRGMQKDSVKS